MIRSFAKSIENRKILAERIAAITKMDMNYTRAPRFAYEIGAFTVEKDGTLIVGEGAADGVVAVLKSEGLIGEELTPPASETEQSEPEQAEEPEQAQAERAETAIAAENSLLGQEDWGEEPETEPEEPEQESAPEAESESTASEPAEATETAEPAETLTETLNVSEPLNEHTETAPEAAEIESSLEMDETIKAEEAEETEPAEPTESTETAETAELAETENPAETENVETVPETQGVEAESEAEAENRIDENCLLGTEDWGDEADESIEGKETEHAAIDETAETSEIATEAVEVAATISEANEARELSQEEQLIEAEQAYEDPLEISERISELAELSNRPSMGASEANAEQPQGAGWDTSESSYDESYDGRASYGRIPTGLSMADMTDMTGFTFPLADHTIGSILNIISMIYTRGPLLSKATGGNFGVDKDLMYILREDEEYESKEYLLDFIKEHVQEGDRLDGLTFTPDSLIFSGFPKENVTVTERAVYERLAERMNKIAQIQKKILAKEITEPNEKYTLRIWLVRMGMGGPDFKFDRKVLLRWLSGHTAFRTEADKEKWQARQKARKQRARLGITGTAGMATHADNAGNENVSNVSNMAATNEATNETPAMSEEPSDSSDVSGKAINY